jgi:hypothetical protein
MGARVVVGVGCAVADGALLEAVFGHGVGGFGGTHAAPKNAAWNDTTIAMTAPERIEPIVQAFPLRRHFHLCSPFACLLSRA